MRALRNEEELACEGEAEYSLDGVFFLLLAYKRAEGSYQNNGRPGYIVYMYQIQICPLCSLAVHVLAVRRLCVGWQVGNEPLGVSRLRRCCHGLHAGRS